MFKQLRWFPLLLILPFLMKPEAATPPGQPLTGPGGAEYKHAKVIKNVYEKGDKEYWIFEPADPTPESAPLVVFNHGWGGTNPRVYGAWIDHIVRRGNIVVYPRYQDQWRYPPGRITGNAIEAVKSAIRRLQTDGHVKPLLDDFAIVGHSAGAQITANMAGLAKETGLPQPKAILSVQPGKSWSKPEFTRIPLENLSKIPANTLLLTVVGDEDHRARDIDAKRIFKESTQSPLSNKDYVIIFSDTHGRPALRAHHFSPCAPDESYDSKEDLKRPFAQFFASEQPEDFSKLERYLLSVDALDYYAYWKLFDGLCDAAFFGKNGQYALGNTPEQRYMGKWSDGKPVKELIVTDKPD
jgi:acetyl esterase/lipase